MRVKATTEQRVGEQVVSDITVGREALETRVFLALYLPWP